MSDRWFLVLIDLDTAPAGDDATCLDTFAHERSRGAQRCETRIYADWATAPDTTALAWQRRGARLIHVPAGTPPAVQIACDAAALPRERRRWAHVLLIGAALGPVERLLREAGINATLAAPEPASAVEETPAGQPSPRCRRLAPSRRTGTWRRIALPPAAPILPATATLQNDNAHATPPPLETDTATRTPETAPGNVLDAAPTAAEDGTVPATAALAAETTVTSPTEPATTVGDVSPVDITGEARASAESAEVPAQASANAEVAIASAETFADVEESSSAAAAASQEPTWEPRARGGTLRKRTNGVQQKAPAPSSQPLDVGERKRLKRILSGVSLPAAKGTRAEQRKAAMETLRRAKVGIATWSELPDHICCDLLDLHGSLARWLQEQGIDAVIKQDFSAALNALRDFSRERRPGYVRSLGLMNGPNGKSWLDDARDVWQKLRRAADLPPDKSALLTKLQNVQPPVNTNDLIPKSPHPVAAQPRSGLCDDTDCARIAKLTGKTGSAERRVAAQECIICGGSSQRRAAREIACILERAGKQRLLVVGGDATGRRVLREVAHEHGIEVRGVAGKGVNIAERKAKSDLDWAEAVAIWPQGLAHKISNLYDDPPRGTLLVRVPGGGITQMLEAFRRELPLPEDAP